MHIRAMMAKAGALFGAVMAAGAARAQDGIEGLETIGKPVPNGVNFQPAVSELARDIHWLDNMVLIIITFITLFVLALLLTVIFKFSREKNPNPATFTHNSKLEVAWTLIPIIVLIVIGSFSLPTLFKQLEIPEAEVTVKATGFQWAWTYEYPDNDIAFDAYMIGGGVAEINDEVRAELAAAGYAEDEWLLATDNAMVVPVNRIVRMQITAADVIHSWKIMSFGVQIDAVPGRLNETWFKAEREGIYFGQCSELCGKDHAYMPITVKVVSDEQYATWIEAQGGTLAGYLVDENIQVAAAQ